jgi:hypothetical protein
MDNGYWHIGGVSGKLGGGRTIMETCLKTQRWIQAHAGVFLCVLMYGEDPDWNRYRDIMRSRDISVRLMGCMDGYGVADWCLLVFFLSLYFFLEPLCSPEALGVSVSGLVRSGGMEIPLLQFCAFFLLQILVCSSLVSCKSLFVYLDLFLYLSSAKC